MKKIISSPLTRVSSFCWTRCFSLWPVSAHSSLLFSLLASAQRPDEVIQRYMEVVAGVPDEVNVSLSAPPPFPDITGIKKTFFQSFYLWSFEPAKSFFLRVDCELTVVHVMCNTDRETE